MDLNLILMDMRNKRHRCILICLISLWIDGFCIGYVFNSETQHGLPRKKVLAQIPLTRKPAQNLPLAPDATPTFETPSQISVSKPESKLEPTAIMPTPVLTPTAIPTPAPTATPAQARFRPHVTPTPVGPPPSIHCSGLKNDPRCADTITITHDGLSPFLTWPRFQVEAGPATSKENFESHVGADTLNNADLIEDSGYFLRAQWSLTSKFVSEASLMSTSGKIADNTGEVLEKSFQTTRTQIGMRYRALADQDRGLGYYVGLGLENLSTSRFSYLNRTTFTIVNRPISFDFGKLAAGIEYRSYYLFRGRAEASYYQLIQARPGGAFNTGPVSNIQEKGYFSLEGSLSHVLLGSSYLGLGLNYSLHQYTFTSSELGPAQSSSVNSAAFSSMLFIGIER